jgi:hypothetical protein
MSGGIQGLEPPTTVSTRLSLASTAQVARCGPFFMDLLFEGPALEELHRNAKGGVEDEAAFPHRRRRWPTLAQVAK